MPYILPQDSQKEADRLHRQNRSLRYVLHRDAGVLPDAVRLSNDHMSILDAVAGSCTWLMDLAELPEVKARCGKPNEIELFASDISSSKFPPKEVLDGFGIKTSLHDITLPFSNEFQSKFDLVNMTLLVCALDEVGFRKALSNVRDILKPGGQLILLEPDYDMLYTREDLDKIASGTSAEDLRATSTHSFLNGLFEENKRRHGHMLDLATRLPQISQEESFCVDSYLPYLIPCGSECRTALGPFGQTMVNEEEILLQVPAVLIEGLTKRAFEDGYLTTKDKGRKIQSEDERKELERELLLEVETKGGYYRIAEAVVSRR